MSTTGVLIATEVVFELVRNLPEFLSRGLPEHIYLAQLQ